MSSFALECNAGGGNTTQNDIADAFCRGDKGPGWLCANTNPGQNTCIYGCHTDNDCKSPNKCDQTVTSDRTHFACKCNSYSDCSGLHFDAIYIIEAINCSNKNSCIYKDDLMFDYEVLSEDLKNINEENIEELDNINGEEYKEIKNNNN
ncbi:7916_t:CDS:2 [Cetraspora pellucida]|uniref:7916_t:CDS:1 n=1 Tax=Cetraspora pellucida TaxID=1433469 RepID=A0ACA9K4T9_9GLOM|nr:7916_t:CDS:2 [Cetraspora pellucida]